MALLSVFGVLRPAHAQQPEAQQEYPTFGEIIDVQVINVDVVVTDRKGNPIAGLKKSDFEVLENGVLQNLTNFYEVRESQGRTVTITPAQDASQPPVIEETETPPPNLQRRVIFFVDNLSLSPFNRNRVFKAMKEFAQDVLRPGDQAMIATWNRSMIVRLPFTPDARLIQDTLDQISGESGLGIASMSERRSTESRIREADTRGEAVAIARSYAQSIDHDLRQTIVGINALMSTLAGIEGKKILVVTSEGFYMQPGAEMYHFIDYIARTKAEWSGVGGTMIDALSFNATSLIQSVANTANAHDITLYAIHAAGLSGISGTSADQSEPVSLEVEMAALNNSTDSLQLMAEMTGGVATVGTNNFAGGFDQIERDLGAYYSLGYRSSTERVDRQRGLEIRLTDPAKRKQYTVRSRTSFVEKSVPTEMTDRVIANLFNPGAKNDMGIFLTTGRPTSRNDGTYLVSIQIHVPMTSLTPVPQGEIQRASFSVWVVAADPRGDMSDVQSQDHTFTMNPDELTAVAGRHYTYQIDLVLNKGRNRISVGVIDQFSRLKGFAQTDILALDLR